MRTFPSWRLGCLSLYAWLMMVGRLEAASFTLTPQQRDAAMEMGRQSVISDRFGTEWKVGGDAAAEGLVVMTPFHRLALAARNATFKSEELKPKDVDALLKEQEGKLTVWATLKGPKADFARFYIPVLVSGQQQIKPTFTQNERTARREDDGGLHGAVPVRVPGGCSQAERAGDLDREEPGGQRRREVLGELVGHALSM